MRLVSDAADQRELPMNSKEIIVLAAELGSLTLWGRQPAEENWEFQTVSEDWSGSMLDEEDGGSEPSRRESGWVSSWSETVALLDARPWMWLVPQHVHPAFCDDFLTEVTRRLLSPGDERARRAMERWVAVCVSG
jgi:hypothetical protein